MDATPILISSVFRLLVTLLRLAAIARVNHYLYQWKASLQSACCLIQSCGRKQKELRNFDDVHLKAIFCVFSSPAFSRGTTLPINCLSVPLLLIAFVSVLWMQVSCYLLHLRGEVWKTFVRESSLQNLLLSSELPPCNISRALQAVLGMVEVALLHRTWNQQAELRQRSCAPNCMLHTSACCFQFNVIDSERSWTHPFFPSIRWCRADCEQCLPKYG